MSTDPEIDRWRAEWRAAIPELHATSSANTSREVRRAAIEQQRKLRAWQVVELVAALVFLAFSGAVLRRNPMPELWAWAAIVWTSTLAATAFSLWNWRMFWTADVKSVAEFVSLYEKRCLAILRAVRFGLWFLAVQLAIGIPWLLVSFVRGQTSGHRVAIAFGILAGLSAFFLLLVRHYWRTARHELEALKRSQQTPETRLT